MATSLLPVRFRSELARQFLRGFTNTINLPADQNSSLTPLKNRIFTFTASVGQVLFTDTDFEYEPGRIQVFRNNTKLNENQYVANDGETLILLEPSSANDVIIVTLFDVFTYPNPTDYHYIFMGRTSPWEDESDIPALNDTRKTEADIKRNILAVKKVNPNDAAMLIRRINWTMGTQYASYTDIEDFSEFDFYVMNPSFQIYKCLYAPSETPSTIMPEQTTPGPFLLSDGYMWQLMYEVPPADRVKFLTDEFIPVRFYSTSSTFDHNAIVDEILLTESGEGYLTPPTVLILGDGVGASAIATVVDGAVSSVRLTNAGSGYTFATAQFVSSTGSGAQAEISLRATDLPSAINQNVAAYAITSSGSIDYIRVDAGGTNYLPTTTSISIIGDGVDAEATPIINVVTGAITGVRIRNRGRGYSYANIVVNSLTAGSGAQLSAVIGPEGGHGSDVPKELIAKTVLLNVNIEDELSDFFLENDFRQVGLIKNIKDYYKSQIFTLASGTACFKITVENPSLFSLDDEVTTDSGGLYIVSNKRGNDVFLLPVIDSINNSSIITANDISTGFTNLTLPEISAKTGDLIYARNLLPIIRQTGQAEQIKLYFSF